MRDFMWRYVRKRSDYGSHLWKCRNSKNTNGNKRRYWPFVNDDPSHLLGFQMIKRVRLVASSFYNKILMLCAQINLNTPNYYKTCFNCFKKKIYFNCTYKNIINKIYLSLFVSIQFVQTSSGHKAHKRDGMKTNEQPNHGINMWY